MRLTVSEPIATANPHRIVNVKSAETPARRVRIGRRSNAAVTRWKKDLGPENVARSSDRVQQAGLALGLQLAPQVGDEHLDRIRRGERVVSPHLVEQAL